MFIMYNVKFPLLFYRDQFSSRGTVLCEQRVTSLFTSLSALHRDMVGQVWIAIFHYCTYIYIHNQKHILLNKSNHKLSLLVFCV